MKEFILFFLLLFATSSAIDIDDVLDAVQDFFGDLVNQTDRFSTNMTQFITENLSNQLSLPIGTAQSTTKILSDYGYNHETHNTTTKDGYVLTIHRIPSKNPFAPVVFLMPGLFSTSAIYMLNTAKKSLAFLLADQGYDVWLGNARGTEYSNNHTNRNLTKSQLFNFTLTEIGIYDIPANIDYVLKVSKKDQLVYVGHSQGTTDFFICLSEKPEYNEKVKLMVAMAPVAYMKHCPSIILQVLARFHPSVEDIERFLGIYDGLFSTATGDLISILICNDKSILQPLCVLRYILESGNGTNQLNTTLLPMFYTHFPKGSSDYVLDQYGQMIVSGRFQKYDYGSDGNEVKYGQKNPPTYNISNIKIPVALYFGLEDTITSPIDVERLASELPKVVRNAGVPITHFDFLIGKNADTLFVNDILQLISQYANCIPLFCPH